MKGDEKMDNVNKKQFVPYFVFAGLAFLGLMFVLFFNMYSILTLLQIGTGDFEYYATFFHVVGGGLGDLEDGLLIQIAFIGLLITYFVRFVLFLLSGLCKANVIKNEKLLLGLSKANKTCSIIFFIIDAIMALILLINGFVQLGPVAGGLGLLEDFYFFGVSLASMIAAIKLNRSVVASQEKAI